MSRQCGLHSKGCTATGMPLSCARGVQELKPSYLLLPRSSQIETL